MRSIFPDEFLAALGRVTSSFAVLELRLEVLTWSLIGSEQQIGHIVTAQLSFGAVVALLSSLYRHRLPDEARWEVLDSILARALEVEAQRNRVTHSLWAKEDTGKTVRTKITAQKRRGLHYERVEMGADDLNAIADEALIVAAEAEELHSLLFKTGQAGR